MILDPQADVGRRVWLPCRYCNAEAPLYLLGSDANIVWVQCGTCLHRWWHDTGCGHGGGPDELFAVA